MERKLGEINADVQIQKALTEETQAHILDLENWLTEMVESLREVVS